MSELNCESVCMAAMAIADGYQPELPREQIESHLTSCAECRRELGQLQELSSLLNTQQRLLRTENIWERIEPRLVVARNTDTSPVWPPFVFLGACLLGYRLVELIPDRDFSVLFKLVPVLFVIAAFSYLRENPFKINSELSLEGES